jgi:hypothetical protein
VRVTGISADRARCIVAEVSADRYQGNVIVKKCEPTSGNSCTLTLRTIDARAHGSRMSWSGRYCPIASWEAHWDVFRALFDAGATRISGGMQWRVSYTQANFDDEYPKTAYVNIGSQICPVTMPELTI